MNPSSPSGTRYGRRSTIFLRPKGKALAGLIFLSLRTPAHRTANALRIRSGFRDWFPAMRRTLLRLWQAGRLTEERVRDVVRTYHYNDRPEDPALTIVSNIGGVVQEEAAVSRVDGWLYRYRVNLADAMTFEIYPLRDGRSWEREILFRAADGQRVVRSEVLSPEGTGTRMRQIARWIGLLEGKPFSVSTDPQEIRFGSRVIPVISEGALPRETLNAIGMGMAFPNIERLTRPSPKGPFLVLAAENDAAMRRLCDQVRRCTFPPSQKGSSDWNVVGGRYDRWGQLVQLYLSDSGWVEKTTENLAMSTHHEMEHVRGDLLFPPSGGDQPDFSPLIPLLTGFLSLTGAPKELVIRLLETPVFLQSGDDLREFFEYWYRLLPYPYDQPEAIRLTTMDGFFPPPTEWFARLGTCFFWEEDYRGEMEGIFPPLLTAFEAAPAGREGERAVQAMVRGFEGSWDRCWGGRKREYSAARSSEVHLTPGSRRYVLDPFAIEEGPDNPRPGFLYPGVRIQKGNRVIRWSDPEFRDFMARHNMAISPWVPLNLSAAEVFVRFLDTCGGAGWKNGDACPRILDDIKEIAEAVSYQVGLLTWRETGIYRDIAQRIQDWPWVAPEERLGVLEGIVETLDSYCWGDFGDPVRQAEFEDLAEILRTGLDRESYEDLVRLFSERIVAGRHLESYEISGREQRVAAFHRAFEILTQGTDVGNPIPLEETICRSQASP